LLNNIFEALGVVCCSGKVLDLHRDRQRLVKEYHFQHMESLNYVQKMHGGSRLQPLEGHVKLTTAPCCVTYEDEPNLWRAQLACGHAVGQYFGIFTYRLTGKLNLLQTILNENRQQK